MRAHLSWILLAAPLLIHGAEPLKLQRAPLPNPPWPAGDERGMANQIGAATWNRCAWHLTLPGAQAYELSQIRSNTMPLSPFAGPYAMKAKPTAGIPMTAQVFNMDQINEGADPGQQGTQFDALGHFGALASDVVSAPSGWVDHSGELDTEEFNYSKPPGLAYKAGPSLADMPIAAIGLATRFTDAVPGGMLGGKAATAEGTPPALPFA